MNTEALEGTQALEPEGHWNTQGQMNPGTVTEIGVGAKGGDSTETEVLRCFIEGCPSP